MTSSSYSTKNFGSAAYWSHMHRWVRPGQRYWRTWWVCSFSFWRNPITSLLSQMENPNPRIFSKLTWNLSSWSNEYCFIMAELLLLSFLTGKSFSGFLVFVYTKLFPNFLIISLTLDNESLWFLMPFLWNFSKQFTLLSVLMRVWEDFQ